MQKKALRLTFTRLRNSLTPEQRGEKSLAIANRCLELPIWDARVFHLFLSIPEKNEVDTSFLLTALQGMDKDIAVPKMAPGRKLRHYLLTDNSLLTPNAWGIPEPQGGIEVTPEQIDVVFVPLLAFDRQGFRVGYGGGDYDRFLASCRKGARTVGLSFFDPVEHIADVQAFDVPLDFCITPEKVYSF
jgi:5-formyltetrahydrofolate cyclo-ligase